MLTAFDGRRAVEIAARERPALLILDLMLPEMSGWDVMRALRPTSQVPVIMLTARDDPTDKVVGLELGADGYVVKPFDPKELLARVRAVLRRVRPSEEKASLTVGDVVIDPARHEVRLAGKRIDLTATEWSRTRASRATSRFTASATGWRAAMCVACACGWCLPRGRCCSGDWHRRGRAEPMAETGARPGDTPPSPPDGPRVARLSPRAGLCRWRHSGDARTPGSAMRRRC